MSSAKLCRCLHIFFPVSAPVGFVSYLMQYNRVFWFRKRNYQLFCGPVYGGTSSLMMARRHAGHVGGLSLSSEASQHRLRALTRLQSGSPVATKTAKVQRREIIAHHSRLDKSLIFCSASRNLIISSGGSDVNSRWLPLKGCVKPK